MLSSAGGLWLALRLLAKGSKEAVEDFARLVLVQRESEFWVRGVSELSVVGHATRSAA
jgi:hypothetical protein